MKKFFVDIYKSVWEHEVFNLAACISFYAILSFIPIGLISVSVLAYFLGTGEIVSQIAAKFTEVIPGAGDLFQSNMSSILKGRSSMGIWGIGTLLVISTFLFSGLEGAFDKIFGAEKKRHFLLSYLLSIAVMSIIVLLLATPSIVSIVTAALQRYGLRIPFVDYLTGKPFFVIFTVVAYIVTVTIVTNHRIYIRYALLGGVLFSAGIAAAKYFFQWYLMVSFSRYNVIYGSLTALILTVTWIYYLSIILLVSSEIVAYYQNKRLSRRVS